MAQLALSLLGPLQAMLDGVPVAGFESQKVRALLAYLALEADHPHARDALAGLLWPNQPDQDARNNLRQALANLRQALGDQRAMPPYLRITRDTVQFNRASDHQIDAVAFMDLLATCDQHRHRHPEICRSCAQRLQHAVDLYHGDFLAAFFLADSAAFEEWVLLKREWLHQRALAALTQLTGYHERRREYGPAQHNARRQLALDPWREESHRQLMRLLAYSGQRSGALVQYATYHRILTEELGVEPEEETTALYERIQRGADVASRGAARPADNLAAHTPLTPFIGREAERVQLADRLEERDCRLLTLVGPGGIGKTRLALQAAADLRASFPDGVAFVPLASLGAAELLVPAIAGALHFTFHGAVDPKTQLLAYLRAKDMLLVLDNFEHLLGVAPLVSELLVGCPDLTVLTTSRAPLHIQCERQFLVPPLRLPNLDQLPDVATLAQYSAVSLFVARAQAVLPSFALTDTNASVVAEICRRLDGLPLAIELAAARVRLFAPEALLVRLNDRIHGTPLRLLVGGPRDMPERQRTLRSTIDWSYDLLAPEEQRLFACLGGFSGGWDLEAAEAVCDTAADLDVLAGLETLVEQSMVRVSDGPAGEPRFGMLETIREYALEQLEACGELTAVQDRHADYFLALAERAREAMHTARARFWLGQLTAEHNNLRAALANLDVCGQPLKLARLCASMAWFWWYRGHYEEAQHWSARALAQHAQLSPALHALLRLECSWFPLRIEQCIEYLETSLALYRTLGDQHGVAWALVGLSLNHHRNGDDEAARGPAEECLPLARALRDPALLAAALEQAGEVALAERDPDRAQPLLEEALALYRDLGNEQNISWVLFALGDTAHQRGAYRSAEALYAESAALRRAMGDRRGVASQIGNVGNMVLCQGDVARATSLQRESLSIYGEIGWEQGIGWTLLHLAECANALDRHERVARLLGAEERIRAAIGYQIFPDSRLTYERLIAATRAALGEVGFAAAWTAGRAMSIEQTSAYALEE